MALVAGEAAGGGRAAGAVLQVRVRVLRGPGRGGRGRAVAGRRRLQVRARAEPAGRAALPRRLAAAPQVSRTHRRTYTVLPHLLTQHRS